MTSLDVPTGAKLLLDLIQEFIQGPSADVEHKMTLFHPDHYTMILAEPTQPKQVLVACCSALRRALDRRN